MAVYDFPVSRVPILSRCLTVQTLSNCRCLSACLTRNAAHYMGGATSLQLSHSITSVKLWQMCVIISLLRRYFLSFSLLIGIREKENLWNVFKFHPAIIWIHDSRAVTWKYLMLSAALTNYLTISFYRYLSQKPRQMCVIISLCLRFSFPSSHVGASKWPLASTEEPP